MTTPSFRVVARSSKGKARTGVLKTAHGEVRTPVFMPVATQATVKALDPEDLRTCGAACLLSNTYHLYLRPGADIIRRAGGLHEFMKWDRPILTDSGGFQVYSLSALRNLSEEGVTFKSHLDGSLHLLTPEKVIRLQAELGSDIWTTLDVCPPYPSTENAAREALRQTMRWTDRSIALYRKHAPEADGGRRLLFPILQGSVFPALRREAAGHLASVEPDGAAIGGLSVGEPREQTYETMERVSEALPPELPRYLMGVGNADDLWDAVHAGADMMDCVWPTRTARNGSVMTFRGRLNVKNGPFRDDFTPLDPDCGCPVCRTYTRAYLCHLFRARELLSHRLLSLHNVYFLIQLTRTIQDAIEKDRFEEARKAFFSAWRKNDPRSRPVSLR